MTVELRPGDCREVLRGVPDASVDSVCTDPPYALVSIGKRFGSPDAAPAQVGASGVYARASAGFMGQSWDTGEVAFAVEFWREVYRVLKPGGHVVAFGGSRTYHRLAVAIEDAGFEIRDQVMWIYGSGFPKSHDVSKGIDKMLGAEREVIGRNPNFRDPSRNAEHHERWNNASMTGEITAPATPEAAAWAGWGTALKPAHEPIVLARKPLSGTVAANVLAHGVGALNIDACRVETTENLNGGRYAEHGKGEADGAIYGSGVNKRTPGGYEQPAGRWPANVLHDGSPEVEAAFAAFGERGAAAPVTGDEPSAAVEPGAIYGPRKRVAATHRGDKGTASRFFYCSKASKADRAGSKHPTVKPVSLMRWLVRLVTPPGGLVLDPFAGSGTTGEAAHLEGMRAVLIEREAEYQGDIMARLARLPGALPDFLAAEPPPPAAPKPMAEWTEAEKAEWGETLAAVDDAFRNPDLGEGQFDVENFPTRIGLPSASTPAPQVSIEELLD